MTYDQTVIRARAIDFTNQGVVITDPRQPDNPIVDVNKAFENMTGYSRADIVGKNCRFLQGDYTDQPGRQLMRQALEKSEGILVLLKNYRKNGELFWNELSISPVFDEHDALVYFIGIQQDVTERENAFESLKETNKQLAELNAMMVDRELRMVELKAELVELKKA